MLRITTAFRTVPVYGWLLALLALLAAPGSARALVPLAGVASLDAGHSFNCSVAPGGPVRCWGSNQFGQIGEPGGK